MSSLITLADLNTVINHEPRVLDTLVAERLGYSNPAQIRELINRNKAELEGYGEVSTTVAETSHKGGRPGTEYWLNEAQALLLCTFSRTEKAAAVRRALIETFMAFRRGELPKITHVRPHQRRIGKRGPVALPAPEPKIEKPSLPQLMIHAEIARASSEAVLRHLRQVDAYISHLEKKGGAA
jgi:hypothetical protein